jgi:hypothetical protein
MIVRFCILLAVGAAGASFIVESERRLVGALESCTKTVATQLEHQRVAIRARTESQQWEVRHRQ